MIELEFAGARGIERRPFESAHEAHIKRLDISAGLNHVRIFCDGREITKDDLFDLADAERKAGKK